MDIFAHLLRRGLGKGLQRRKLCEQRRCDQVYARIGALGRQARGDQQLQRIIGAQGAHGVRVKLFQCLNGLQGTVFFVHAVVSPYTEYTGGFPALQDTTWPTGCQFSVSV